MNGRDSKLGQVGEQGGGGGGGEGGAGGGWRRRRGRWRPWTAVMEEGAEKKPVDVYWVGPS